VSLLFDEFWDEDGDPYGRAAGDNNTYTTGRIANHNVVLVVLPGIGNTGVAGAAASIRSSYGSLTLALLVGICGGVPIVDGDEALLGDVIISKSLIQYDFGRQYTDSFVTKHTIEDALGRANRDIRGLIASLETELGRERLHDKAAQHLKRLQGAAVRKRRRANYRYPGPAEDKLFAPDYPHRHREACAVCASEGAEFCETAAHTSCIDLGCDEGRLIARERLREKLSMGPDEAQCPETFIGRVASGNTVVKSAKHRDHMAARHGVIAFEMEGAGARDEIPCIIVKGICDYADSHKNKRWQDFAAATAASVARAMLERYNIGDGTGGGVSSGATAAMSSPPTTSTTFGTMVGHTIIAGTVIHSGGTANFNVTTTPDKHYEDEKVRELLHDLASDYEAYKDINPRRLDGTCEWFFNDPRFYSWRDSKNADLLWVSAPPGCGKSVLARSLIDEGRLSNGTSIVSGVCYFFFKDGDTQRMTGHGAISALLHQLFSRDPTGQLVHCALPSHKTYGGGLSQNYAELWRILSACAASPHAGEIICVLDALDECTEKDRAQIMDSLVDFYIRKAKSRSRSTKLKFLITSRPYDSIEALFEQFSTATGYARIDADDKYVEINREIDLVIDAKMLDLAGTFRPEDRLKISERLKAMENRTYFWLHLTFNIIEQKRAKYGKRSNIEKLLSAIPNEVSEAYEKILSRNQDEDQTETLLQLILASSVPLELEEANVALTVALESDGFASYPDLTDELWPKESFKSIVKNLCGLFITVHNSRLFLIHQTAREFLTHAERHGKWRGRLSIPESHAKMTYSCIRFLSLPEYSPSSTIAPRDVDLYPFLLYAALFWPDHYSSQDSSGKSQLLKDARTLASVSGGKTWLWALIYPLAYPQLCGWTNWVDWSDLTMASYFGLGPVVTEILAEGDAQIDGSDGYWGSAINSAAAAGRIEVVQILLDHQANTEVPGRVFKTALLTAVGMGQAAVVKLLLGRDNELQITEHMIEVAAGTNSARADSLALILERAGDEVEITNNIFEAAARSYNGRETLALLLEKCGNELHVTDNILENAAGNWNGKDILGLLIEKCGDKVRVTEKMLLAAVHSQYGVDTVGLLLEKRRDEVQINDDVLKAAAKNLWCARDIVAVLLNSLGNSVKIPSDMIRATAADESDHRGRDVLALLLDTRREEVQNTPNLLKTVVVNYQKGKEITEMLLDKLGDEIQLTEDVIMALATQGSVDTMKLLLQRRSSDVQITEDIVEKMASGGPRPRDMLAFLLEVPGMEIPITHNVVKIAAANWKGEKLIQILLKWRGHEMEITQEIVKAAAGNMINGIEIMVLLLEKLGDETEITDALIKAAEGKYHSAEIKALFLERRRGIIQPTEDIASLAASRGKHGAAEWLRERRGG
jgi:nucleoside phosphorylase